jgi:putative lipoic acid-binding regulatory protein
VACTRFKLGCNGADELFGSTPFEPHFALPQEAASAAVDLCSTMKILGQDATKLEMEFPCEFPIKVMGYWAEDFDALVMQIIRRHVDNLGEGSLRSRESRGGRYMSVTVTIEARSREQLDAIYRDLTAEPRVVMAL